MTCLYLNNSVSRLRNNSGMVMITVLMVVMVMMIMVVGIISRNTSQAVYTQDVVAQIKAEELAKGAYWLLYTDTNAGATRVDFTETIDGRVYTVTYSDPVAVGPNQTNSLQVDVTY